MGQDKEEPKLSRREFTGGAAALAAAGAVGVATTSGPANASAQTSGRKGMLYFLDFKVEYPAEMKQKDLFKIWAEEADAALGTKKSGAVVDLWKVVGERRVVAVVNIDTPDALDQVLMDLPIMKQHGQHVRVDVKALRRYEDFAEDVKKRLG